MKMNHNVLQQLFGSIPDCKVQYYRANKRCMAHVQASLKRIKSDIEKRIKQKLTGFSYIREFDVASHSTKVADRKRRKIYISLMLGQNLYLDEFCPFGPKDETFYVIEGLSSSWIILSATMLKDIFAYIPTDTYELGDNYCQVTKTAFIAGARTFASRMKRKKT